MRRVVLKSGILFFSLTAQWSWGGTACEKLYGENLSSFREGVREVLRTHDASCLKQANEFARFLLPSCLQDQAKPQLLCEENYCYWSDERARLTKKYTKEKLGYETCTLQPKLIVTHYTECMKIQQADNIFKPALLSGRPDLSPGLNVGCHYLVDREGGIHKRMDECQIARHVIGLNQHAICIENMGTTKSGLTSQQVEANAKLIHYLTAKYHSIDAMIGHSEYRKLEGVHSLFRDLTKDRTSKVDPGNDFLRKLRTNLAQRCTGDRKALINSSGADYQ